MLPKFIGVILIIAGCGAIGFRIAAHYRYEERLLRQFLTIIDYMECELSFRLTPLPILCRQAVSSMHGPLQKFFLTLASELDAQISPDVASCIAVTEKKTEGIPSIISDLLQLLGNTLGHFDLQGQMNSLAAVKKEAERQLTELSSKNRERLRSYQTLGICAGVSLAIIFL